MPIPGWYFRLRDSRIFTLMSGVGYVVLACSFLLAAFVAKSTLIRVLLFSGGAVCALGGVLIIWNAGRVTGLDHEPPKDGMD